jgi:hypothetical protein
VKLFGFEIGTPKKVEDAQAEQTGQLKQKTFTLPQNDDGAVTVAGAGYYGTYVDLDGTFRNETQLITKYRELAIQPEMETAIDEIVNESIVIEESGQCVELNMDELRVPPAIKKRIEDEFNIILKLLNFNNMGHDIFRRYYVDGRLFYHIVIDEMNPILGIQELKYIDPRRIRKIREIQKMRDPGTGIELIKRQIEYYLYNEKGMIGSGTNLGSKIAPDSIVNVNSGLMDPKQAMVLSYLHKAIKPFNNLRMVEDATVIYRLSRAPERRVFYIDVGNMPTVKADQYVRDIMVKYRNKLVYDSGTGEIKDDRKHLSMLEDFWLPRREGSKGTEITTLEGARNLGELEDVKYFQSKLYRSLNVPIGRLEPQQGFSLGRSTEITRDELKFTKFIQRLRNKFSILFDDLLRVQLVLKKVCTEEEWKEFKEDIFYDFKKDNNFDELKEAELLNVRLDTLTKVDPFVGKYYSQLWVRKHILMQSDEDIEEIDGQMQQENAIVAQQQQQQMIDQQAQQQQDQQNQLQYQAQQQITQAVTQKEIQKATQDDEDSGPGKSELASRDHESNMMDKKIELEKIKSNKSLPKKTVAKEAKDLGLIYVGNNQYADTQGNARFINENGILVEINKD